MSDWLLEIKLTSYSNPTSTTEDGRCCDSSAMANCSREAQCDNTFCFFLQPYGASYLTPGTVVACIYYIVWDSKTDSIQFGSTISTQNIYLENPLAIVDVGSYVYVTCTCVCM